jgi:hypothetical protein
MAELVRDFGSLGSVSRWVSGYPLPVTHHTQRRRLFLRQPKGNLMGALDKLKGLVGKNGDKIAQGVDKATDMVDKKTGGKHTDKLDKIDDAAKKLGK